MKDVTFSSGSKAGMTLIEVLVATMLLVMGLATFLASFSSMQRVSVMSDNQIQALHRGREILESVLAQPYDSVYLNNGTHTMTDVSYSVTADPEFVATKNIEVSVPWVTPIGNETKYVVLTGSMAQCIHE